MLDSFAFGGDHPGKVVFQSLLIVDALSDLAYIDDPLSSKTEEAQKILGMLGDSGLKDIDASLMHLINGIALFKSNIKQAQKALLKVAAVEYSNIRIYGERCQNCNISVTRLATCL